MPWLRMDESWRKGQGVPPLDEAIGATLTADGDQTILVIEVKGMPPSVLAAYGAGRRSTPKISPPTSPGVSARHRGALGRARACLSRPGEER